MFQYPDFEQPNQFHLQQLIHSLDGNPRLVGMVQKSGVGGGGGGGGGGGERRRKGSTAERTF